MTIDELLTNLISARNQIEQGIEGQITALSLSAAALITNRVIQTGKDGEGRSFGDYSERQLPLYYFEARVLRKAAFESLRKKRAKVKDKKNRNKASYKEFRENQGLQTQFKDFFFSGQFVRSIRAVVEKKGEGNYLVVIKPGTEYGRRILIEIEKQIQGDYLAVSQQERQILQTSLFNWTVAIFKKNNHQANSMLPQTMHPPNIL